jgi:hypothetical protein
MTEYAFPRDLLDGIKSRWQIDTNYHFKFPDDRVLQTLLEICYHASFRTSEQRVVQCALAFVSIADLEKGALRLSRPIVLTDSQLVRLSPVTKHRQTVIGCEQVDGRLRIWGFFDYGHSWMQHSTGDPPADPVQLGDFPPDCLTIAIEGPGALAISQGRTGLVRLQDGQVIFPQEDLFQSVQNPLGRFFRQLIDDLLKSNKRRELSTSAAESAGQRTLLSIYTTSILAILERIRLTQHGGSIVITRVPFNEQLAHITYDVADHVDLADDILAYKRLHDFLQMPRLGDNDSAELEKCQTRLELHGMSRRLIRGIGRISRLAASDGAVLLDHNLRVQGFGVRFPLLLPPGTTVLAALTGSEYLCDRWGLRHQSVFSTCQKCEQAVGLIVSQDGEVKAVKSERGQLMYWDGILD